MSERTCGTCTLCCKVLGVKELEKPAAVWCPHVIKNQGCGIYAERPDSCRKFECLWLKEASVPDELKPERSHVVLSTTLDGEMMVAHVDVSYPNPERLLTRGAMGRYVGRLVELGVVVFGVFGDERRLYYHGKKVPDHIREKINQLKLLQRGEE